MSGQVINTNIMSLNAQRNLGTSRSDLATALQRLSSGLRINSAKDDAAGLAISERFTTQIRGLNQAVRNANDGISLAQTAEGALQEVTNNLQRIRELAVQSANATNSASDRQALDAEVQERIAEINRIASVTSFNTQKILDGTFGNATFQVGANVGETISVGLNTSARSGDIGSFVNSTGTEVFGSTITGSGTTLTTGANSVSQYNGVNATAITVSSAGVSNLVINGTNVAASVVGSAAPTYQTADSAFAKAAAINASGIAGVTASANTTLQFDPALSGSVGADKFFEALNLENGTTGDATATYTLSINGVNAITTGTVAEGYTITLSQAVQSINSVTSQTGVQASVVDGRLQLQAADGRNVAIAEVFGGAAATGTASGGTSDVRSLFSRDTALTGAAITGSTNAMFRGQVSLASSSAITLAGSAGPAIIGQASTTLSAAAGVNLANQNVTTVMAANNAIQSIDAALTTIGNLRSKFGAVQNRFESTIANLHTVGENLNASRSRIRDADFAAETAALTRAQILQQAGVAILAQANAAPQQVLGLLR